VARNLERSIERLQSRVFGAVFGATMLFWFALIACACACVALGARAAFGWDAWKTSIVFAPVVLAPLIAVRAARSKRLSDSGAAAWLDLHAGADGALVTGFESNDESWRPRVDAALARASVLPRARLGRPATMAVGACGFAALALFVPIPRAVLGPSHALQTAAIEKAEEKLATLEEEVTLEPELAQELHASLDRLKESDDALASSESVFEAADRASDKLADEAARQADPAESLQRELAAAAAAASADPEAAQKQLEAALEKLAESGLSKGLTDVMTSELGLKSLELSPGTKLDAAQIARLSSALNAKLGDKLAKLAAAGLLKPGKPGTEGKPAEIAEIAEHVCTDECRKNPGGT
jgi:hypothetical protein